MDTTPTLTDLQKIQEEGTTVPFKIKGINENGYFGKVFEYNAFVPFFRMPFEYDFNVVRQLFFKSFTKVVFNAKIFTIHAEREFLVLDLKELPFETIRLKQGRTYNGLIVHKAEAYLLIELGALFNWKHGSILGFMSKSMRDRIIPFNQLKVGDPLSVSILRESPDNHTQYVLHGAISWKDWDNGDIYELLNKRVSAKVTYQRGKLILIVDGKHKGLFPITKRWYERTKFRYLMKEMISNLRQGDEITVKVVRFKEETQTLIVEWIVDRETEVFYLGESKNTLADRLESPLDLFPFED